MLFVRGSGLARLGGIIEGLNIGGVWVAGAVAGGALCDCGVHYVTVSPTLQVSCARSTPQSAGLGALGFAWKLGEARRAASGSGMVRHQQTPVLSLSPAPRPGTGVQWQQVALSA